MTDSGSIMTTIDARPGAVPVLGGGDTALLTSVSIDASVAAPAQRIRTEDRPVEPEVAVPADPEPTLSRRLGRSGLEAYPVALDGSIFGWVAGPVDTNATLDAFAAAGGTLVSTADHYAGGRSEIMIGNWLRDSGLRDRMIVATKIGRHPDAPGLEPSSIRSAVESSFERLGLERIDVLSFDGEDRSVPIERSLEAVAPFIESGRVGAIAAAAYSGRALRRIEAIASEFELPRFAVNLAEYNLMQRKHFEGTVEAEATEIGISTIAKLPLASGYLRGDFRSKSDIPDSPMYEGAVAHVGRHGSKVLTALSVIAAETGSTRAVVALAWLLSRSSVASVAVRAASAAELRGLIDAPKLTLTRHQLAHLDRVSS